MTTVDRNHMLTVHNEGKGFDTSTREKAHAGFGLIIMRERMRAMGEGLRWRVSWSGTTVTASVPLER